MKKIIASIGIYFGLLFTCSAQLVAIQQKIDSLVSAKSITGIIIGTLNKGQQQFFTAGWANVEKQERFTENTQLEIGSITKTFTAYILESVLKAQKISDTGFILPFLPDSVQANKGLAAIRFIHLLNHTAGFPRLPSNMGTPTNLLLPYEGYTRSKLYSYLVSAKIQLIGSVNYSNLGMGLAGDLAEVISDKSYEQLLKKYISKSFKLKHTALTTNTKLPISTGYFNKDQPALYWNMEGLNGAGGIKSTATDMVQYASYILSNPNDLILQNIVSPTTKMNAQISIAKSWHIFSVPNNAPIVWHNGGTYGFSTFIAINTITQQAVFLAINEFNKNKIGDNLGITIITKLLGNNE